MTNDSPTLFDAVAGELNPVDPHAASLKIAAVLAPAAKWAHLLKSWCSFFALVTGLLGLFCFLIWMKNQKEFEYFYHLSMFFCP